MEKNKFYVPTIEEFHVGFEYEVKVNNGWITWKVNPLTFSQTDFGNQTPEYHEHPYKNPFFVGVSTDVNSEYNKFRVKYLDKEDIESLGWKFIKQHPGTTTLEFEKTVDRTEYALTFDMNFSKFWSVTISDASVDDFNFFHGYIKNKSELKVLMQQLNIT